MSGRTSGSQSSAGNSYKREYFGETVHGSQVPGRNAGASSQRDTAWAMSEENVEVVRRAFDNFMPEGSVSDLLDDFTDDALKEFVDPGVELVPIPQGVLAGGEYVGFEGLRRFWADFFGAWDEVHVEPLEFREVGDLVVSIGRFKGRMHDLEIDEVFSNLFTLRNGRVVQIQNFGSRDAALKAAGLPE